MATCQRLVGNGSAIKYLLRPNVLSKMLSSFCFASSVYHDANILKACGEINSGCEDSSLLKLALQIFDILSAH